MSYFLWLNGGPQYPGGTFPVILPKNRVQSRQYTADNKGANYKSRCYFKQRSIHFDNMGIVRWFWLYKADRYHNDDDREKGDGHTIQEWVVWEGAPAPVRQKF